MMNDTQAFCWLVSEVSCGTADLADLAFPCNPSEEFSKVMNCTRDLHSMLPLVPPELPSWIKLKDPANCCDDDSPGITLCGCNETVGPLCCVIIACAAVILIFLIILICVLIYRRCKVLDKRSRGKYVMNFFTRKSKKNTSKEKKQPAGSSSVSVHPNPEYEIPEMLPPMALEPEASVVVMGTSEDETNHPGRSNGSGAVGDSTKATEKARKSGKEEGLRVEGEGKWGSGD